MGPLGRLLLTASVLIASSGLEASRAASLPAALTSVQVVPLLVQRRIDHFDVDPSGQRLFVAALGNHTFEVLDLVGGKPMLSVPNLNEQRPPIDRSAFPSTPSEGFWTSSVSVADATQSWWVAFIHGHADFKTNTFWARCVCAPEDRWPRGGSSHRWRGATREASTRPVRTTCRTPERAIRQSVGRPLCGKALARRESR
jgi:hypothetical protein